MDGLNAQQLIDKQENKRDSLRSEGVWELCKFGKENFEKIDSDKDGWLSLTELTKAASNATGEKQKKLNQLRVNVETIQSLSDDESFFENDGITKEDLSVLQKQAISMTAAIARARDLREPSDAISTTLIPAVVPASLGGN